MCSSNICIKISWNAVPESDKKNHGSSQNVCLPQVEKRAAAFPHTDCHCQKLLPLGACPTVSHKCQSLSMDKGILASQQAWGTLLLHRLAPKPSALCTRNQCHPPKTPGESKIPAVEMSPVHSLSPAVLPSGDKKQYGKPSKPELKREKPQKHRTWEWQNLN